MIKFLIIYPGSLGDILLTRPILYYLKNQFPNCQIDYAGNPEFLPLLKSEIHTVYDFNSSKLLSLFSQKPELSFACRAWLESYRYIIFWSELNDPLIQNKLATLNNTKFTYRTIKPDDNYANHQTVLAFHSLKPLSVSFDYNMDKIISNLSYHPCCETENLIYIHPGSGSKKKNLPLEIYIQMKMYIQEKTGFRIVFIIGPNEKTYLKEFKDKKLEFIIPEDVIYLKETLGKCKYYIGNDSGVTHLAAQLGIPTLAIFVSTNPMIWAPLGKNVLIVHNQISLSDQFIFVSKFTPKKLSTIFLEKFFVR